MHSTRKTKKFMPETPAKKTRSVYGGTKEMYSPYAKILKFEEDSASKMVIKTEEGMKNRFHTEFEII
jgi:hypothetical protein